MHPIKLLPLLLLVACPARATYVASGHQDFAIATTATCVPNGGGVSAGHMLVFAIQVNALTSITITSLRATWGAADQSQTQASGTVATYIYHARTTGAGAETITATLSSGSALMGAACGEYTTNAFDTSNSINGTAGLDVPITTSFNNEDLVGFRTTGTSSPSFATFTVRETILSGVTPFAALADFSAVTAGPYLMQTGGGGGGTALVDAFYSAVGTRHKSEIIRYHPPRRRSIIRTGGK